MGTCSRDKGFKLNKNGFGLNIRFFHGVEALAQAALRSWGWPIPEGIQGQAGEASGHLDLVGGVRAWGREVDMAGL